MTTLRRVAGLYDDLCRMENRFRRGDAYPVHKSLCSEALGYHDVYAWLVGERHILPHGTLLDAGCGVGYGSQYIAAHTANEVTGVTLSDIEARIARQSAVNNPAAHRLTFAVQSFDDLAAQAFDQIVAVESLKHSPDIGSTLRQWQKTLSAHGRIIIVDDFYQGGSGSGYDADLCVYWHLSALMTLQHVSEQFDGCRIDTIDLTDAMVKPSKLGVLARSSFFMSLKRLGYRHQGLQAFIGGCALEMLYQQRRMRYLAVIINNVEPVQAHKGQGAINGLR